jgi:hypothetical protein
MSDKPKPGTKGNPIPIKDISEARSNQSYIIEPAVKEKRRGETVSTE